MTGRERANRNIIGRRGITTTFEDINENYEFGKFRDVEVIIEKESGYMNITKICRDVRIKYGLDKKLSNWKRTSRGRIMLEEVSEMKDVPCDELLIRPTGLPEELRGTYAHPSIAPFIAMWASPIFSIGVFQIARERQVSKSI